MENTNSSSNTITRLPISLQLPSSSPNTNTIPDRPSNPRKFACSAPPFYPINTLDPKPPSSSTALSATLRPYIKSFPPVVVHSLPRNHPKFHNQDVAHLLSPDSVPPRLPSLLGLLDIRLGIGLWTEEGFWWLKAFETGAYECYFGEIESLDEDGARGGKVVGERIIGGRNSSGLRFRVRNYKRGISI